MEEPSWWTYLKTVAQTEDGGTIAEAAGVTPPQVSRWKTGKNRPDADKLARFARNYGKPPVEALVAAGYLTANEAAEVIEIGRGLGSVTDEELLAEIQRRMKGMRNALEAAAASRTPAKGNKDEEVTLSGKPRPPLYDPELNKPIGGLGDGQEPGVGGA